jgi:hypothetical protein
MSKLCPGLRLITVGDTGAQGCMGKKKILYPNILVGCLCSHESKNGSHESKNERQRRKGEWSSLLFKSHDLFNSWE